MAKQSKDKEKEASKAVTKKPKRFKLGPKASLFYDPRSGKKIVGDQVVEFLDHQMATEKFQAARRGNHIVEADSTEQVTEDSPEVSADMLEYLALTSNEARIEFINKTYDLTEEDQAALLTMSEDELLVEVKGYEGLE